MPFLATLPVAFLVAAALAGAVLERTLYRRLYGRPHLDQVLFSIGLVFMAVATVDYFIGSQQQNIQLPAVPARPLRDRRACGIGRYRLFIIVVCAVLTLVPAVVLSSAPASAAGCARRSTTRAWRAAWALTSTRVPR